MVDNRSYTKNIQLSFTTNRLLASWHEVWKVTNLLFDELFRISTTR